MTLYARISPLGSIGTSQIMRAEVKDTSGKDTFDGGPGTVKKHVKTSFEYLRLTIFKSPYTDSRLTRFPIS